MENENMNKHSQRTSLPPRSTIHAVKTKNDHATNKKNSIYMLLASFAFIVIIASFVYGQFTIDDSKLESDSQKADSQKSEKDMNNSNDSKDKDESQSPVSENSENKNVENGYENKDETTTDQDGVNMDDSEDQVHVIKAGENLYRISLAYYSSGNYYLDLANYNDLSSPDDIYAGLTIKIPNVKKFSH